MKKVEEIGGGLLELALDFGEKKKTMKNSAQELFSNLFQNNISLKK